MIDVIFSGRNVFMLYLVLAGSFLQPLFPCHSSRLFTQSMWVRHILGFLTLIFFVVVTDTELDAYIPFGTILATSAIIYFWFLISSKMTANWWLALVVLLAGLYLLDIYESRIQGQESSRTAELIEMAKNTIIGVSLFLTTVGFLIYVGEKKLEYKRDFSYGTLLLGTTTCKNTPTSRPYWDSLKAAFMETPGRSMVGGGLSTGGGTISMAEDAFLDALSSSASTSYSSSSLATLN